MIQVAAAVVSKELLVDTVLSTFRLTRDTIINITKNNQSTNLDVQKTLDELDVNCEISVAEAFAKDLEGKELSNAVTEALRNMHDASNKLSIEFIKLSRNVQTYENMTFVGKWWYGFFDIEENLNVIKNLSVLLRDRFLLLIRVTSAVY